MECLSSTNQRAEHWHTLTSELPGSTYTDWGMPILQSRRQPKNKGREQATHTCAPTSLNAFLSMRWKFHGVGLYKMADAGSLMTFWGMGMFIVYAIRRYPFLLKPFSVSLSLDGILPASKRNLSIRLGISVQLYKIMYTLLFVHNLAALYLTQHTAHIVYSKQDSTTMVNTSTSIAKHGFFTFNSNHQYPLWNMAAL